VAKGYRAILLTTLALTSLLLAASSATAGKIYQLDLCWFGPIPTYPAHITVNYYEGDKCQADKLKGTSSMDFEWLGNYGENWNFTYDACAFLTSAWEVDGQLRVCFTINGHDNGKFKKESAFQVVVNGATDCFDQHTSCSQVIPIGVPLDASDPGTFFFMSGVGGSDCLPGNAECPGDKAYELDGEFHIPLNGCVPTDVVFKVYHKESELKGTSTAVWNGSGLDDIICDSVACLTGAYLDGDWLVVSWDSFGYQSGGEFGANTTWELDLGACGVYKKYYHTSCSQIIRLNTPFVFTNGADGYLVLTDGCAACITDVPIPTQEGSWSTLKSLY